MAFRDRKEAGQLLAAKLASYAGRPDVVVLALPRGGVPVAAEVSRRLHAPLDVFLVRKLGVPGREELAMGAIASGGIRVINEEVVRLLQVPRSSLDIAAAREQRELERRERLYRGDRPVIDVTGATVILVDDGLATGTSMRAAIEAVRRKRPRRIVIAVPIAPRETCAELAEDVDELVCGATPEPFYGVGFWYEDFSQTGDDEVRALLGAADQMQAEPAPPPGA